MNRRTLPAAPALSATLFAALAASVLAGPQDRQQIMVVDDGQGPTFFHAMPPDIRSLATPDFVRDDLPLFAGKLSLSEVQRIVVETLLSAYLEQFDALRTEKLPGHDGGHDGPLMGAAIGAPGGIEGVVRGFQRRDDPDGLAALDDFDIDDDVPMDRIAIAITADDGAVPPAGVDGPQGALLIPAPEERAVVVAESGAADGEEGPRAGVVIAVDGPDNVELPEEVRKQLQEKAAQMAEEIRQRMEANQAAGLDPLAGDLDPREHMEQAVAGMEQLAEQAREFARAKEALKQRFVADVQSQLAPEQLSRWPNLDRALTRRKTLPQGRLDGERTDLTRLAERLALAEAETEAIAEALEAYEVELHEALRARNDFVETARTRIDEALQAGKTDQAISLADRAAALRVAVRGVNLRYAESIAERLGPQRGAEFRGAAQRAFFPRVYGRTRAMRTFQDARRLEGLEPDVLAAIEQLEAAYLQELAPVNEHLRQTIETHQPRESRRSLEHVKVMMEGAAAAGAGGNGGAGGPFMLDRPEDPIREAMQKRSALDEGYMKQLYALLSAEQIEKLPKLPSRRRTAPMFITPN